MLMVRAMYVGSCSRLKNKTALTIKHMNLCYVLAQFDDRGLDIDAKTLDDCVAHGWKEYDAKDFKEIVDDSY